MVDVESAMASMAEGFLREVMRKLYRRGWLRRLGVRRSESGGLFCAGPAGEAAAADGWRNYTPGSKTSVCVEQDGFKARANKDADRLAVPEHPAGVIVWILYWFEYAKMK